MIAIAILIFLLIVGGSHLADIELKLGSIDEKLDRGFAEMGAKLDKLTGKSNPGNPAHQPSVRIPSERKPEQKPTGGGALVGMLIGGALGAPGGPPGMIIGGILGALIGNQLEYENIRKRKGPPLD